MQRRWIKLNDRLNNLTRRMEKLEDSITRSLNSEWKCSECGAKGKVAVRFKCTACDDESWWGYHKDQDEEEENEEEED